MWGESWERKSWQERAGMVMWTSVILSAVLPATLLLIQLWHQQVTLIRLVLPPLPLLIMGLSYWLRRQEYVTAATGCRLLGVGAALATLVYMCTT